MASFHVKKSLGQNFLVDLMAVRRILEAVGAAAEHKIVEIGPGRGIITEGLVETGASVTCIELDRDLIPILIRRFGAHRNFSLIEGDALEVDFAGIIEGFPYATLVANLPYYISTAILQKIISERPRYSKMILMFQKEVVDRITAPPGTPNRGFISVMTESYYSTKVLFTLGPGAFEPSPKVNSAVVEFRPIERSVGDFGSFRAVVSRGFAQRRKTILNNLKAVFPDAACTLEMVNIDPRRRAETLSLDEWIALSKNLANQSASKHRE
jgi:16S rRNA (adenine1518-N6/adenine1519-N6)-dimethyltransferase